MMAPQIWEGTWEELAAQAGELAGTGKKITLIIPADEPAQEAARARPNEAALEALRRVRQIQKDMPMTENGDSVALVREARAGAMHGDASAE